MRSLLKQGRDLYTALNTGDANALQQLLSNDFKGQLSAGLPSGLGGDYLGLDAMMGEAWAVVDRLFDVKLNADYYFDAGDVLVVHGFYDGTSRQTGRSLRAAFAHFWVHNGTHFIGMRQVTDTAMWHNALRQPTRDLHPPEGEVAC